MRLNSKIVSTIAMTFGASIIGCAGQNNAQVTSSIKMTGTSSAASVVMNKRPSLWNMLLRTAYALVPASIVDSSGSVVTLSSAWVVIKELEFKSSETVGAEDDKSEIEFKGPYFVNLLSNVPVVLDTHLITQKDIKRIKMNLESTQSVLPNGAPAGLANNSVYFAGTVGANNFAFQLNDGTEIQIAGPNSFQPAANSQLLVEIQIANIFKQINLSTVTNNEIISQSNRHPGVSLCPSIDPSAADLYSCLRKGLEAHANFGEDKDGDNILDHNDEHVK